MVAPPYDVIDRREQERLYEKHPHNCVRLILSKEPGERRYGDSARTLKKWLDEKVFAMDTEPAIYEYAQGFEFSGRKYVRKGFIARVKIEDFESGVVLPHESTFKKHKDDRLKLTRACDANLSQVFCVYSDPEKKVEKTIESSNGETVAEIRFDGVTNTVRRVSAPETLQAVSRMMADKKLLIADGHHRYETAINYRNLKNGAGSSGYVMMFLCGAQCGGLIVEPTHRVIRGFGSDASERLAEAIKERFDCRETEPSQAPEPSGNEVIFVYGGGNRGLLFSPPGGFKGYKDMGAFTLRDAVIADMVDGEPEISFTKSREEVLSIAREKPDAAGFIMPKPRISDIMAAAGDGVRMPHKTTYFHPKILSGVVINPLWE